MIVIEGLLKIVLKMKKIFFFLLLMAFTVSAFSQGEPDEELDFVSLKKTKKNKKMSIDSEEFTTVAFKLSFLMPSVAAEFKLSDKFSIELAGKLNFAIYMASASSPQSLPKLYFFPLPVVHLEPKWNYNAIRRLEKGKNVSGFSSNFISLFTSYRIKVSPETFHSLVIGPTWGMQRKLGKLGYLKFNTGLAYTHVFDPLIRAQISAQGILGLPIGPIIDIQLGLMF